METLSLAIIVLIISALLYAWKKEMLISQMIVVINFIVFLLLFLPSLFPINFSRKLIFYDLAFNPSYLISGSKMYTLFTSLFLHGDVLHILMNMLFLLLIGIPFEQRIGRKTFAFLYFSTGICACLFFSIFEWGNQVMLIGASGAIFGLLGAFAALYPRDKVVMPLPSPIIFFVKMPVIVAALLFTSIETLYTFSNISDGIAHTAHIGGLISGIALSQFIKKRKVKEEKFDFLPLEAYITTERQKEIFRKAKEADVPEVREAWLSYLLRELKCPKCGGGIKKDGTCKNCGFFMKNQ
ncbi:MAG: rhomboid family intramembrane serine protease [Thermoplasmata archaeon]|nr:MAG: rhomboid family intramembrane serine protease [Thermoplasmata archaeon]